MISAPRRISPLSVFLAACALTMFGALCLTAALADHLLHRSQVELLQAAALRGM
ncbi:hypothetical protein [Rhodobacter sp. NSM]|uniref:hypothetical protein n=1 Tax=Rhodobacter sp. NSM TaxID=3457501 RepID=UPI003FD2D3BA